MQMAMDAHRKPSKYKYQNKGRLPILNIRFRVGQSLNQRGIIYKQINGSYIFEEIVDYNASF